MALGINYNDPRYQKAVLAAGARTETNTQGLVSRIQSQFVTNQMQNLMTFRQQALTKDMHKDRMALGQRRLSLDKTIFDRQYKMGKQRLSNEKSALNFTSIFGLGTGLYSAIEGQRRRKATEALTQENRQARITRDKRDAVHQKKMEKLTRGSI